MAKLDGVGRVGLTRIPRTTLTEALFEKLIGHVINGDWKEGERIPGERELCEQLGIGRASLREALKALELLGLLDSRVGDGTFICPRSEFLSRPLLWAIAGTDRTELRELLEARLMIEENIAGLAAERASAEELLKIRVALEEMRNRIDNPSSALESDLRFHVVIAEAAHNQILLNSGQLLRNQLKHWLLLKHQNPSSRLQSFEHHQRIYEAIRRRNPSRARKEMRNHLMTSGRLVAELILQH